MLAAVAAAKPQPRHLLAALAVAVLAGRRELRLEREPQIRAAVEAAAAEVAVPGQAVLVL